MCAHTTAAVFYVGHKGREGGRVEGGRGREKSFGGLTQGQIYRYIHVESGVKAC